MNPTDASLLSSLISEYEKRGISMEKLFNSDFYKSLPTDHKLSAVKTYGARMSKGIRFDKSDMIGLGIGTVGLATAVGMAALNAPAFSALSRAGVDNTFAGRIHNEALGHNFEEGSADYHQFFRNSVAKFPTYFSRLRNLGYLPQALLPAATSVGAMVGSAVKLKQTVGSIKAKYETQKMLEESATTGSTNKYLDHLRNASIPH